MREGTTPLSLKESSDELNPPVVTGDVVVRAPVRGPLDLLALAIATFGVGFIPIAPGTWGSLVGVGLYLLLRAGNSAFLRFELTLLLLFMGITVAGIWAASRTERIIGRKDPGKVVVDEVAGQLLALLPISIYASVVKPTWIIVSFILFRFFDIVKPYPARRMEALHGGLGIMCDDLVAGLYAAVGLVVVVEVLRFF